MHRIEQNSLKQVNQPVKVGYVRSHYFRLWHLREYAFSLDEYSFVNWLAPDGVLPACAGGYRCMNVGGMSAGSDYIVYDLTANIHWDRMAGVGCIGRKPGGPGRRLPGRTGHVR